MFYIQSEEAIKLLKFWASNCPESFHYYDDERFVDFVFVLLQNGETLSYSDIEEALKNRFSPKWIDFIADQCMVGLCTA